VLDGKLSSTVALFQLPRRNRGAPVLDPLPSTGTNAVAIGAVRSRGLEWDVSGVLVMV
jgi:iron complex outermembrane receptor protein